MSETIEQVQASAGQLTAVVADPDPTVERLRSLVCRGGAALTILRVGLHDLRRVDVWTEGDEVGVVPFREDVDAQVACGIGSGTVGKLLVFELLADPDGVPDGAAGSRHFDDVGALVQAVAGGVGGLDRASVLHAHGSGSDLVRVVGDGVWWDAASSGEKLEARADGDAAYWAAVLDMLGAVT